MTLRTTLVAAAVAAAMPGAALAATAYSSTSLNVRSGPGTNYRVVDQLRDGERVEIDQCNRGYTWCHVSHRGPDGWVAARYLNDRRYGQRRPINRFGLSLNIPQLDLRFGVGRDGPYVDRGRRGPPRDGRDGRGRRQARVCFYEDYNFGGNSFCANEGQARRSLGNYWNDRISSIRVMGNARVRVCEDFNYGGRCRVLSGNKRSLSGRNNDVISSFRVM
jgi:uncharacterized protein YraI